MNFAILVLSDTAEAISSGSAAFSWYALFSGFVGGLIVLSIQTYLTNRREKNERKRELKGLFRIVDLEMENNEPLLQQVLEVDVNIASGSELRPFLNLRSIEFKDWNDTKGRIARLAEEEHFRNLYSYYRKAEKLHDRVDNLSSSFAAGHTKQIQELTRECKELSDAARRKHRTDLGTA